MKKLALSLAVLFSVAMVSCGGHKEDKACDSANDSAVLVEEAVVETDSTVVDSAAEANKDAAATEEAKVEDSAKAEQK